MKSSGSLERMKPVPVSNAPPYSWKTHTDPAGLGHTSPPVPELETKGRTYAAPPFRIFSFFPHPYFPVTRLISSSLPLHQAMCEASSLGGCRAMHRPQTELFFKPSQLHSFLGYQRLIPFNGHVPIRNNPQTDFRSIRDPLSCVICMVLP